MQLLLPAPNHSSEVKAMPAKFSKADHAIFELKHRLINLESNPTDGAKWDLVLSKLKSTAIFRDMKEGLDILDRLEHNVPYLVERGQYDDAAKVYSHLQTALEMAENSPDSKNYVDYCSQRAAHFMRLHRLSRPEENILKIVTAASEWYDFHSKLSFQHSSSLNYCLTLGGISNPAQAVIELNKLADQWDVLDSYDETLRCRKMAAAINYTSKFIELVKHTKIGSSGFFNNDFSRGRDFFVPPLFVEFIEPGTFTCNLHNQRN